MRSYRYNPLMLPARGPEACLRSLIALGANPKVLDKMQRGALHCLAGKDGIANWTLVRLGVSVHARDVSGRTPLHNLAREF